jgi:hypothetical protein
MLAVSNTPGKVFAAGELVDNDKLNLLGTPLLAVNGGLEWTQMKVDDVWYGTNSGVANAYLLTLPNANNDRSTLVDGVAVCFKPSLPNSLAATTLALHASTGATILEKLIKKRNNQPLVAGDLQAGVFYHVRYDSANDCWQLLSPWGTIGNAGDIAPGQFFYATGSGSSTAYTVSASPAPSAHVAGMHVFVNAPATNINAALTMNLNSLGTLGVKKGNADPIEPGDMVAGQVYLMVLEPGLTYWILTNPSKGLKAGPVGTPANAQNLAITRPAVTTVSVTADQLAVQNSNKQTHLLSAVTAVAIITGAGAGGLDTSTEALDLAASPTGVWYYIWVIWNSTTDSTTGLLSRSSTAPTMPSGYDFKALAGCVRNNAASDFIDFWQSGARIWFAPQNIFTGKTAAVAGTYEALTAPELALLSAAVPPLAKVLVGNLGGEAAPPSTCFAALAADTNGLGAALADFSNGAALMSYTGSAQVRVPMKTAQTVYVTTGAGTAHRFNATGYEL